MNPALHFAKFLTWMTTSNNKFHMLFRCHVKNISLYLPPVVIKSLSISCTRQSFCVFLPLIFLSISILTYLLPLETKQSQSCSSPFMHSLFTLLGFCPSVFWFSFCDVFLDNLVPLKTEAKWVDSFVNAWVSLQKLGGRALFQVKVHHSFVFCIFHPIMYI